MALNCLIKLLPLAAVVAFAYGGGSKHCRPRSSAVENCPKDINDIILYDYANKGVRTTNVEIEYRSGDVVSCGNFLSQLAVSFQPKVTYNTIFIPLSYYAIILIDVDSPDGKVPFLHWMVVNVAAGNIGNGELGDAMTPVSYLQPYLNWDRHVFLIYYQKKKLTPAEVKELKEKYQNKREKFPVKTVANTYGLEDPVVGQYFVFYAFKPRSRT